MLTQGQKRHLRKLAHPRRVIVQTGDAGLSDGVLREVDLALSAHELVKIRVLAADRAERDAQIARACSVTGAELVQRIGHVAVLYRRNPDSADPVAIASGHS